MLNQKDSEMHLVLELALEAGRVLLSNGAEIFRVEETIEHICRRFEIEEMDSFVLSNGIFLTAHDQGKEIFAKVKNIPLANTNLAVVTEVNNLSREIAMGKVGIDEAFARLQEIEKRPVEKNIWQIVSAGIASGAFCYLMGGNIYDSLFSILIGGLLYVFILFTKRFQISKIIVHLVGGSLIALMALAVMKIPFSFPVTLDKMIIGCLMPMIPGVAFVNSIRDIADSDFISGLVKLVDALLVFVYIAVGVGFVLSIFGGGNFI